MKSAVRKSIAAVAALLSAGSLVACSTDPSMSPFQNPRPWQAVEGDAAYEKLDYSVAIYDVKKGTAADKREKIADGTLFFTLEYNEQTATGGDASLDMAFSVTYNDKAPKNDAGKTDTITGLTRFRTDSLETISMSKTVSLAEREGEKNMSYSIVADYSAGKATRSMFGKEKTLKIPGGKYWDNETMYYLARATSIKKNDSTNFTMTNLFECFENDEVDELTMIAAADEKLTQLEFDEWIKPYVITKEQEDAEKEAQKDKDKEKTATLADAASNEAYKIPCYGVSIVMNVDERGPAQVVYYSERPIEVNGVRHKKVPLKMTYTLFEGSKAVVLYEYTLTGLAFEKQ